MLDNAIGETIQMRLNDSFPEHLSGSVTGIIVATEWFLAKLIAVDQKGMWLENPEYIRIKVRDENNNIIPPSQQKEEKTTANVLIRWEYVDSIIRFPKNDISKNIMYSEINRIGFI